jgi:hypothetical protein
MVASAFSPSPETDITVPNPKVSCETRSPIASCRELLCFPVGLGGVENFFLVIGGVTKPLADLFHSIRFSGISSKNREGGL